MDRKSLNGLAERFGIENPEKLPNKGAVIVAIKEAEAAAEAAGGDDEGPGEED